MCDCNVYKVIIFQEGTTRLVVILWGLRGATSVPLED